MTQSLWSSVDQYFTEAFIPDDPVLEAVLHASEKAGLPPHNVSPTQGQLLMLLAMSVNATSILEIGTLGGYSTIWLARALPEKGHLVTLEADAHHAEIAQHNIQHAGLQQRVSVRVGAARHTLDDLIAKKTGAFDVIFVDADKENNVHYFEAALQLSHSGSLIIVDNVVRGGAVIETANSDPRVLGVRRFVERVAKEPRVVPTALQTVGSKGYDGLAIMLVKH
jgi:predicted O-methyltransferase YrrM